MNLTLRKWLMILGAAVVVLIICTGFLTHQLLQEQERAKALEESNQIYEKDLEVSVDRNNRLNDSIEKVKQEKDQIIKDHRSNVAELKKHILKNQYHEEDIIRLSDLDSIGDLFTRYYPDYSGTGQASN